jgi:hypothetical protein
MGRKNLSPSAGFVDEQADDPISGRIEVVVDGPSGGNRNLMFRGTSAEEKSDADSGIHGKYRSHSKKAPAVCPAGFGNQPDEG